MVFKITRYSTKIRSEKAHSDYSSIFPPPCAIKIKVNYCLSKPKFAVLKETSKTRLSRVDDSAGKDENVSSSWPVIDIDMI